MAAGDFLPADYSFLQLWKYGHHKHCKEKSTHAQPHQLLYCQPLFGQPNDHANERCTIRRRKNFPS